MAHGEDVLRRFAFHPATEVTGPLHNEIREVFATLARRIINTTPAGRHQSLALTALQESMMWCNAAIAVDTDNPGTQVNPHSGPRK